MTPTEQDKELPESIEQILRFNCPASCDGYGTYAEADGDGNPIPLQCQWCYEYGMPARESITADRKRVELEARLDELNAIYGWSQEERTPLIFYPEHRSSDFAQMAANGMGTNFTVRERIAELKQELEKL